MADTERTSSDLLTTLFQDGQAAGAITPNDIRDLIASMIEAHAATYVSASASTAIGVSGTYYKLGGTFTSQGTAKLFTVSGNRLTYTGTRTSDFLVLFRASFSVAAGTNRDVRFRVAKNGTTDATTQVGNLVDSTDTKVVAGMCLIELAANDYIELFVTNATSTDAVTASLATLLAKRLFE